MGDVYLNNAIDHYEAWIAAHSGPAILSWNFLCGFIGEHMGEDVKFVKTLSAFMNTQFRDTEAQIYWFPGGRFVILYDGHIQALEAIFNAWNKSMAKQFAATVHEFHTGRIREDHEALIDEVSVIYRRLKRVNPLVKTLKNLRTPEGEFIEGEELYLSDVVNALDGKPDQTKN